MKYRIHGQLGELTVYQYQEFPGIIYVGTPGQGGEIYADPRIQRPGRIVGSSQIAGASDEEVMEALG